MNEKPDLQNKYIASDQKQPKNSQPGDSSERLAICSMVAGIVGVLCACCCFPSGLICGAIGIVMAIMSRNADIRPKKSFCTHAVIGLVLCAVAVALTFFVCYAMIAYYSAIREPEKWPYLSEMIKQFKQVVEQVYGVPMDSLPMP